MPSRHPLTHGLSLTLRRLPAVFWTYAFNLILALLFSLRLHAQLSAVLNHSLNAQRLTNAFDLGPAIEAITKIHQGSHTGPASTYAGVLLYLAIYFLLVPGTLYCYQTNTPARLSTLLHQGLQYFWRFLRITILALLVSAILLGPLTALHRHLSTYIDAHVVGRPAFLSDLAGALLIALIASILRLYFDLVEVHTVQLGQHLRIQSNGTTKPDRRVHRTLLPAWRTLRLDFFRNWLFFLLLTILGAAAVVLTARFAIHSLAQPRVWPAFLLTQLGLFLMLFTRFWQRAFETALAQNNPIIAPEEPHTIHSYTHPPDPIPNPEPASPSLPGPDPQVFHHDVGTPPA